MREERERAMKKGKGRRRRDKSVGVRGRGKELQQIVQTRDEKEQMLMQGENT